MKLSTSIPILVAGTAMAEPMIQRRQLTAVTAMLTPVLNQLYAMEEAVSAFDGSDLTALHSASSDLDTTVRKALVEVELIQPLTIEEAIAFQPLSDETEAAADAFHAAVTSKIPIFGPLGLCPIVLANYTILGDNVVPLMTVLASKFPDAGADGSQAAENIQHFQDSFDINEEKLRACAEDPSYPTVHQTSINVPHSSIDVPHTTTAAYGIKPTGGANANVNKNGTATSVYTAPTTTPTFVQTAAASAVRFSAAGGVAAALLSFLL